MIITKKVKTPAKKQIKYSNMMVLIATNPILGIKVAPFVQSVRLEGA